jgi:hypothetical protein
MTLRATRNASGLLLIALSAFCVLGGCVTSEASRYRGTVTGSVPPERRASNDVAGAFNLNSSDADVSLAVVSE